MSLPAGQAFCPTCFQFAHPLQIKQAIVDFGCAYCGQPMAAYSQDGDLYASLIATRNGPDEGEERKRGKPG